MKNRWGNRAILPYTGGQGDRVETGDGAVIVTAAAMSRMKEKIWCGNLTKRSTESLFFPI
jgi:hypothetical protein